MHIWTVHPKFLDAKALQALWSEGLQLKDVLEKKVEEGIKDPELSRFIEHEQPLAALCEYLHIVCGEAAIRGLGFDPSLLPKYRQPVGLIEESQSHLEDEWLELLSYLRENDSRQFARISMQAKPEAHPLFRILPGAYQAERQSVQ